MRCLLTSMLMCFFGTYWTPHSSQAGEIAFAISGTVIRPDFSPEDEAFKEDDRFTLTVSYDDSAQGQSINTIDRLGVDLRKFEYSAITSGRLTTTSGIDSSLDPSASLVSISLQPAGHLIQLHLNGFDQSFDVPSLPRSFEDPNLEVRFILPPTLATNELSVLEEVLSSMEVGGIRQVVSDASTAQQIMFLSGSRALSVTPIATGDEILTLVPEPEGAALGWLLIGCCHVWQRRLFRRRFVV